ncbi:MAG: hypothetical protein ABJP34_08935 [Erythrobacter sp.]
MTDIKVAFPKPCAEPWEEMEPKGCNRHCASCDKIIHDLSAFTIDEAEELLETEDEVCVRARVKPDGVIDIASSRKAKSKRLVAVLGASATLATAACSSIGSGTISPRYQVSGSVGPFQYATKGELRTEGRKYTAHLGPNYSFKFTNLHPGTYTLSFNSFCSGDSFVKTIIVRDANVDLGKLDWEEDCIIIGVMRPADPPRRV